MFGSPLYLIDAAVFFSRKIRHYKVIFSFIGSDIIPISKRTASDNNSISSSISGKKRKGSSDNRNLDSKVNSSDWIGSASVFSDQCFNLIRIKTRCRPLSILLGFIWIKS